MTDTAVQNTLSEVRVQIPMGSTWRHRRGEEYLVVGHCVLAGYRVPAILCRGMDSIVWCRPATQFLDGRFSRIDGSFVGTAPAPVHESLPEPTEPVGV